MNAFRESVACLAADSFSSEFTADAALGASNARGRERNLNKNNDPLLFELVEEGKEGRRGEKFNLTTQAAHNESYKPEKSVFSEKAQNSVQAVALWDSLLAAIRPELSIPAYETWFTFCRPIDWHENTLIVAVSSEHNRDQFLRRYGARVKTLLAELTGSSVGLRLTVAEVPEETQNQQRQPIAQPRCAGPSKRTPWAATQNPTNNPEIDTLLDCYGDMRGIFRKWGLFKKPLTPAAEGGWNLGLGTLIQAGKTYGLERVIWATRQAAVYVGADDRGKVFFHILRNGLRED